MYKIGITGSIGTGKTTIANLFALFKVPIFDADKEIKKILNSEKIKQKIQNKWPHVIRGNEINKSKLKSIIFSNKYEKIRLEKLLYPYLEIEKDRFEKTNYNKNILVYDVPLIFETKTEKKYDLIILTNCNIALQRKRVLNRDKISNSLFEKIIKSQLSYNEKIKFKPEIINTKRAKFFILLKIVILLTKIQIKLKLKKWKTKEN
tara:strand:- start:182 stop:796 length:615 start_codon:yes stop_codon:yes gene_type:complete